MVMHLLEDSFDKGLWDYSGYVFLAILPVYVVQQTCVIIPIESLSWNLLLGYSFNLAILMQYLSDCCKSFCFGQVDLTQWATVLTYLNLGFIYGHIFIIQWVIVPFPGCKG